MADESRLSDLMTRWQEERARGRDVTVSELCRDCPELTAELARRFADVRQEEVADSPDLVVSKSAIFGARSRATSSISSSVHTARGTWG